MIGRRGAFSAAIFVLLWAAAAPAQDIQNFKPAAGTWNYLSVEGARVARHLEFIPSLVVNYANQPFVVLDEDGEVADAIVEHMLYGDLILTLGLADYFELSVDAAGALLQSGNAEQAGTEGIKPADLRIIPKLRLFGLDDDKGFGMAIVVPVSIPVGEEGAFVGEPVVTPTPKLVLEGRGDGFAFATNFGVQLRFEDEKVGDLDLRHEAVYGVGGGFDLGSEDVVLITELFGKAAITDVETGAHANPMEIMMGLRIFTDPGAVITLGAGAGLINGYGSPRYRLLFGFAFHDRRYDRDEDGILDKVDSCKDVPEDKDGFEDRDGCPDIDNDQDEVLDIEDRCPLIPEDIDGFEDEDGCPDPDNDGDGFEDKVDKCPNEPETVNNWLDKDGCPDEIPDTDGDGLKDPDDKCPAEPEDKDGFEDEDGCPDPDNDQDRIPDVTDKCPMGPETYNDFEDEDGCPDTKTTKPVLVKVTKKKIEILEKVFFKTNKAVIKPESYDVLNQVAEVMVRFKYIKKIRVEGHTDDRGRDSYNLKLSQKRADAVREYLVNQGVEPERLESMGYGETVPIDDNKTKDGRANNRRVEFTIVEQ